MNPVREQLVELAANLRWIWHGELDSLLQEMDAELWQKVQHNPVAFIVDVDARKVEIASADPRYRERVEQAFKVLRGHEQETKHWSGQNAPGLATRPIAYFSPEFGLHESLPIYSGGLGILAGDHLKSSSDLGIPIWGITLLYRQGYFRQRLDERGRQTELYEPLQLERVAIKPALDAEGKQRVISLAISGFTVPIAIWCARVGRATLVLLDSAATTFPTSQQRHMQRLYAGDSHTRLLQEIVLGAGGWCAMRALGVRPGVLHLNEGHSAFAALEAIAKMIETEGIGFDAALQSVRSQTVFTTHTPVAAGHDRFDPRLVAEHLDPLRRRLGLTEEALLGLGRTNPADNEEPFCMTVLALKLASRSVGVSALHGQVSRTMWQALWPSLPADQIPIQHVTNGVHVPSWIASEMAEFLSRSLAHDWASRLCEPQLWDRAREVDHADLWETKHRIKNRMIDFIEQRARKREERLGLPPSPPLDRQALTIGLARRFAEYKRAPMLLRDPDRLARLLTRPGRPVQILVAGKAHPKDEPGKVLLQRLHEASTDPRYLGRLVIIEDYDMNVGRHLVQGCDLWLNTPRRPLEACGTSGQKAVFNGTLNVSTLDGWWAEAYDGHNGYAIGDSLCPVDQEIQDARDSEALYEVLESKIVPDFFDRDGDLPARWLARIQHAWVTLGLRYNSDRMLVEYTLGSYLPASRTTPAVR